MLDISAKREIPQAVLEHPLGSLEILGHDIRQGPTQLTLARRYSAGSLVQGLPPARKGTVEKIENRPRGPMRREKQELQPSLCESSMPIEWRRRWGGNVTTQWRLLVVPMTSGPIRCWLIDWYAQGLMQMGLGDGESSLAPAQPRMVEPRVKEKCQIDVIPVRLYRETVSGIGHKRNSVVKLARRRHDSSCRAGGLSKLEYCPAAATYSLDPSGGVAGTYSHVA
ncbi:hypothetical protein H4582DRAFT_2128694 [Lactarius indigo]|nr:hypothetical protein H4582DRAFT_2128694 [Lactarius indigo]